MFHILTSINANSHPHTLAYTSVNICIGKHQIHAILPHDGMHKNHAPLTMLSMVKGFGLFRLNVVKDGSNMIFIIFLWWGIW